MSSSIHVLNTSLGGGLRPPSEPPPGIAPAKPALEAEHLSRGARIIRFVRRQPTLVVGVVWLAIIALGAAFAPVWWTGDPLEMRPAERLTSPVTGHWFGTDNFGRDVYTRTIYGTRISLIVGATVSIVSLLIGTTLGLVIGFYRRLDAVMMRVMDGLMAIPAILLALALMALMKTSVRNVIIALVIPEMPSVIRVVRTSVLSLRAHTVVEGARLHSRARGPPARPAARPTPLHRSVPHIEFGHAIPSVEVARTAGKPALEPVGSSAAYVLRQQQAEGARAARLRTLSRCAKRAL